jgi:hypothetical protein
MTSPTSAVRLGLSGLLTSPPPMRAGVQPGRLVTAPRPEPYEGQAVMFRDIAGTRCDLLRFVYSGW